MDVYEDQQDLGIQSDEDLADAILNRVGNYRRWLWAALQAGRSLSELTAEAPYWAADVVATAYRREARIQQQMKAITGPGPDARTREV